MQLRPTGRRIGATNLRVRNCSAKMESVRLKSVRRVKATEVRVASSKFFRLREIGTPSVAVADSRLVPTKEIAYGRRDAKESLVAKGFQGLDLEAGLVGTSGCI